MRKTVGARELKTRLGGYIRQVRRGLTIVVTEHGEPVAELRPLGKDGKGEAAKLEELVKVGVVTRQKHGKLKQFTPVRARRAELAKAIIEDREDRL